MMRNDCRIAAAAVLWGLALSLAGTAPARAADSLAIVFDGSGSMWGKLGPGPQSKLVAGRDGLLQALPPNPENAVGLVSFGRRRGDCSDVELVTPVDIGDRQRIAQPLERLNPRGRGPITLALRTAAKALDGQPGQHHVLIIHDEPDNCSLDACAAVAELKAADPRLVVSTVTLGATVEEVRAMACLSQTTGGRAFSADTPTDAVAAVGAAVRFAALSGASGSAPPAPVAAARPATAVDRSGPPRARLSARLVANGPLLIRGLQWRIWPAGGDGATLAETREPAPDVVLEPGRYRLELTAGLAVTTRDFEIKGPGILPVDVVLEAAQLRTSVTLRRGAAPSPSAKITVRPDSADAAGAPAVWIGGPDEIILPPGPYRVMAAEGQVRLERRLTLAAGQTTSLDFPLEAGRVMLSAVARDGGPQLDDVTYRVLESDPEARGGLREVMSTSAAVADLLLPAGTYQIVARQGGAETRDRISVAAGEETRHTFRMGVGRLVASARLAGAPQPLTTGVRFRVTQLDGPQNLEPTETFSARPSLDLPAGRYRVEARLGPANAQVVRDIDVRPGVEQQLALELRAAEIQFRPADSVAGAALAEVFWEISDVQNRVIWRSVQVRPTVALAEGRYVARLAVRGKRFEKTFEVKTGSPGQIALGEDP